MEAGQSGKGEGLTVLAASSAEGSEGEGEGRYLGLRVVGACSASEWIFCCLLCCCSAQRERTYGLHPCF